MGREAFDPAFRSALREAIVLLGIFAVALVYTIVYCYVYGYGREPASIVTYAGIPDWVFWGVFAPWAGCIAVTVWFCFYYMADDDLEPPGDSASSEAATAAPEVEPRHGD